MKKLYIPLMLALLLSACGFHLRGMIDVPNWLNNVAIISKGNDTELVTLLRLRLESYKINVNLDPALAKYWLIIDYVEFDQHVVGIGASTNPRQYQMILKIGFKLQDHLGIDIKPNKMVQVTRQFTSNNDRILGSNDEQSILISEMRQEAVNQIITRLSK